MPNIDIPVPEELQELMADARRVLNARLTEALCLDLRVRCRLGGPFRT